MTVSITVTQEKSPYESYPLIQLEFWLRVGHTKLSTKCKFLVHDLSQCGGLNKGLPILAH